MSRLVAAVLAATSGLAFWWGLTEPLPLPAAIALGVPAVMLACVGLVAGRLGALATPLALLFSLFVGSIIATQLHQAFVASSVPVSRFGGGAIALEWPALALPLALAAIVGAAAGAAGERVLWSGGRLAERERGRRL